MSPDLNFCWSGSYIQIPDLYILIASLLSAGLTHSSSLTNEEAYFHKIPYSSLILFRLLLLCYFFIPIWSAIFKLGMPNEEEPGTVGYQWACGSTGSHGQVYFNEGWTFTHLCGLRIIFEWLHGDLVHMLFMLDPSEYTVEWLSMWSIFEVTSPIVYTHLSNVSSFYFSKMSRTYTQKGKQSFKALNLSP